jgi:ferric-dicitrate binding protein FerR (iron transport regulator)
MDDLLIKYLLGEATPEEAAQVDRWLEADAVNRKRYEQYKRLWAISRRTAAANAARSGLAGSGSVGLPERIVEVPAVGDRTVEIRERGNRSRTARLRLAAVTIGILLLGVGGYLMLMNRRPVQAPTSVTGRVRSGSLRTTEVPPTMRSLPIPEEGRGWEKKFWRGEKLLAGARPRTDTLPDGTVVTLNGGASLELVGGADGKNGQVGGADGKSGPAGGTVGNGLTVRLHGEGFFNVTHDPTRAFVVQVGDVAISVLGTSFELNEQTDSIELVVETGAVRVRRNLPAGGRIAVHAGEQLSIAGRGGWRIGPRTDNLYGYYLGRPLVCESVPLRKLVEVLNRADNTTIVLGRKELGDLPLTTVFREKSPQRILDIIAMTFNLSVVRQGPEIILQ